MLPILAVVGPTATGKSDVGVELALRLNGEIINADASQFYRGMDVGTAKLSVEERRGVPHHLLDVLDLHDEPSAAQFQREARQIARSIQDKGKVPILVGGTGLYVRAVLDVINFPGTDPSIRARYEQEAQQRGVAALYQQLLVVDPVAAAAMEPRNTRRIVRALEVIELTGEPYSANMPKRVYYQPAFQVGLDWQRPVLFDRINVRAQQMVAGGLIEETMVLLEAGLATARTASRALGYAQVLAQLPGNVVAKQVVDDTAQATRRFAKRQQSWFRPDPRIMWCHDRSDIEVIADEMAAAYGRYVESIDAEG